MCHTESEPQSRLGSWVGEVHLCRFNSYTTMSHLSIGSRREDRAAQVPYKKKELWMCPMHIFLDSSLTSF